MEVIKCKRPYCVNEVGKKMHLLVREWLDPKEVAVKSHHTSCNEHENKGVGHIRSVNRSTHENIASAGVSNSVSLRNVLDV